MDGNVVAQIVGSIILAAVPAFIWLYIFYTKQPEDKRAVALTFIIGGLSVAPILLYRYLWEFFPWINAFQYVQHFDDTVFNLSATLALPLSIILTFMIVGVLEEVAKHYCVRTVNKKYFASIDDVIEFSIIAALGFAFIENILYFNNIWATKGVENLLKPFLFRSVFSTFAHVMFSGVFGYYYGLAIFAKPILQDKMRNEKTILSRAFYNFIHLRQDKAFYDEKILEGLILSVLLHAAFNIFLELNLTFLTVPYLVFGYITLSYLFEKKENHKRYGLLLETTDN